MSGGLYRLGIHNIKGGRQMDPEAALAEAREAMAEFRRQYGRGNYGEAAEAAVALADSFAALDGWLSKGGFAPAAWKGRLA
jgi:hypothetical protein